MTASHISPTGQRPIVPTPQEIATRLSGAIAAATGCSVNNVDLDQQFESYGLSSLEALRILGDLEQWLGIEIKPSEVINHQTVQSLCEYLHQRTKKK